MTGSTVDAEAFNAFEAAGWETTAGGYDDFFGQITPRPVERLLDAAHIDRGIRMLDVACGPGYAAGRAAERGALVIGVDIADAMVALARRRFPQLEFRRGSAEALPFADGSFDAVVGNFAMHHLGDPQRAVNEFARVLVAGGRLALTLWDVPSRARFVGVFLDAVVQAKAVPPKDLPVGPDFFRFSHEEEFARLLSDRDLDAIEVSTISFKHRVSSSQELCMVCSTARSGRRRSFVLSPTACSGASAPRSTACWTNTERVLVSSYRYRSSWPLPRAPASSSPRDDRSMRRRRSRVRPVRHRVAALSDQPAPSRSAGEARMKILLGVGDRGPPRGRRGSSCATNARCGSARTGFRQAPPRPIPIRR